jgi:hypothetical protein
MAPFVFAVPRHVHLPAIFLVQKHGSWNVISPLPFADEYERLKNNATKNEERTREV